MPKLKYQFAQPKRVPFDPLRELITRYQKARGLTCEAVAMKCGYCNGAYYINKRSRGVQRFKIEDFCIVANALDIPPDEVGEAVESYYKLSRLRK